MVVSQSKEVLKKDGNIWKDTSTSMKDSTQTKPRKFEQNK